MDESSVPSLFTEKSSAGGGMSNCQLGCDYCTIPATPKQKCQFAAQQRFLEFVTSNHAISPLRINHEDIYSFLIT